MNFTRNLKMGMSGNDVLYIKKKLFDLGYFAKNVKRVTSKAFRKDTYNAVIFFQGRNQDKYGRNLEADGIIGQLTWDAIEKVHEQEIATKPDKPIDNNILKKIDSYTHISKIKREKIKADLRGVSELRQQICVEILNYAYDQNVPGNVRALYMIGANLYNKDLRLNIPTESDIRSQAKSRSTYYNNGRMEWMIEQVKRNPNIPSSDCSGMEVGYMRKHKLVSNSFDTTANNLCLKSTYSTKISRAQLQPGDWVGKNGHIGTYVGGGFVVEFYGGAFGCQLTNVDNRIGWNFVTKKKERGGAWTRFRRPKAY